MSDPQDLLYTNRFISENILSDKQLTDETKYYDRFKNYIDNNKDSEIEKYIDNDTLESSPINLNKTLNRKWPITNSRNHYPLFDTYINDISSNSYQKDIITKINIDSANRDLSKYLYPNSFSLPFPKVFRNIKSIVLNDLCIKNPIQSVSFCKNALAWQFASGDYLVSNNIDLNIIPVPDSTKKISYVSLPYSVVIYTEDGIQTFSPDNFIEYDVQISLGNYTTKTLINEIRKQTQRVLHIGNGTIVEQPYLEFPYKQNCPNLFSIYINPISSIVKFVNRIEEIKIIAIQSFSSYENDFQNNDIFYPYTSLTDESLSTSFIYITVIAHIDDSYQYFASTNNILTPSAFPLVITDLDINIGNVDFNSINYTEFYDLNIYTNNGLYSEDDVQASGISYYKFSDYITINSVVRYLRFAFWLVDSTAGGADYTGPSPLIGTCITENIIFSNVLNNFLQVNNNLVEYTYLQSSVLIGRALLFRWIFDIVNCNYVNYEVDTQNVKQRSLLHMLGFPISNQTTGIFSIGVNDGFRFVHTNLQQFFSTDTGITLNTIDFNFKLLRNPQLTLNLLEYQGEYYFISNSYIYIKIRLNTNDNIVAQEPIVNAISSTKTQYNQIYIDNNIFSIPIGQDFNYLDGAQKLNIVQIDQNNIFAKILVSNMPGNIDTITSNIINNNSFSINYDHCIDNISEVAVSLYDTNLQLLELKNDFSFTLNFTEMREVLKETSINSKTNQVHTEGYVKA